MYNCKTGADMQKRRTSTGSRSALSFSIVTDVARADNLRRWSMLSFRNMHVWTGYSWLWLDFRHWIDAWFGAIRRSKVSDHKSCHIKTYGGIAGRAATGMIMAAAARMKARAWESLIWTIVEERNCKSSKFGDQRKSYLVVSMLGVSASLKKGGYIGVGWFIYQGQICKKLVYQIFLECFLVALEMKSMKSDEIRWNAALRRRVSPHIYHWHHLRSIITIVIVRSN